jgi:methionine sulfoxide reductase heme-binding subunit
MWWHDRAGRFSPLKAITLALCCAPAVWIGWLWASGQAQPRMWDFLNHRTGDWALRFFLATLAVTPFRVILRYPRLFQIRRMLGLAAFCYLVAHFTFYVLLEGSIGLVASEIAKRVYLIFGFSALLCFTVLAVTSFDALIARMGVWWKRVHWLIYPATALGVLHYMMQSKITSPIATTEMGLLAWLLIWRASPRRWRDRVWFLALYALIASAITAGLEVLWFEIATSVNVERIFAANFRWGYAPRPAVWVLIWAAVVPVVVAVRQRVAVVGK